MPGQAEWFSHIVVGTNVDGAAALVLFSHFPSMLHA